MGTSTRYLRGGGEWKEVSVALGAQDLVWAVFEATSLTPTWAYALGPSGDLQ